LLQSQLDGEQSAGVAVDSSNNLYTAEFGNNRVLKFNTPLTTDTFADVALGQLDFVHNGENLIRPARL
jgi:hypothetical protein